MHISARHLVQRPKPNRVEDLHFRITGPVVGEMQQTFAEDWFLATDEILAGPAYYPELERTGRALCRSISSGPDEHIDVIHCIMHAAISEARESVRIATPYFIPSRVLIDTMGVAAMRGVDVRVVLPSHVDMPFMRWAADAYLWQLLQTGVRIFRRPPPFVHTKLMVVDGRWVLLGSANLDPRSFRLNFEFNIEVYDREMAAGLGREMGDVMRDADEVTLEDVDARSKAVRLRDGLVKLFSPYL
jgi:cardiolipin synthase